MITAILRKMGSKTPGWVVARLISIWPPYLGAGIKVMEIAPDYRYIKVCLKQAWYNRNYVGTQFGGSLYAMTDPFFMLMFINNLGHDYYVWDKGATIDFVSPGKTKVTVEFRIDDAIINKVLQETASGEKYIFDLPVEVLDADGALVATVLKKLYVRKKKK
ncbi:DUF4442 domain-containing protein [Bdellovibrio sp. HCB274]|uniref:DUF4442 domain-containing protein n=1 Tax=Bdellovibrio sp. HCB274 TaxID=3394361 RepID=UPI0039B6B4F3